MPKADRAGVTYKNGADTARTKAAVLKHTWVDPDPILQLDEDIYEFYNEPGVAGVTGKRLKWRSGDLVRTSVFDAAFPVATVTSITPATGPAAGGTAITIKGTNLRGSTGATVGVAVTSYVVVNDTTATAVTGATTAGVKTATVTDDSGTSAALAAAYTYV